METIQIIRKGPATMFEKVERNWLCLNLNNKIPREGGAQILPTGFSPQLLPKILNFKWNFSRKFMAMAKLNASQDCS